VPRRDSRFRCSTLEQNAKLVTAWKETVTSVLSRMPTSALNLGRRGLIAQAQRRRARGEPIGDRDRSNEGLGRTALVTGAHRPVLDAQPLDCLPRRHTTLSSSHGTWIA
jgi:hypothetical protein